MKKCIRCGKEVESGKSISVSMCLGDPDNPVAQNKPQYWHPKCLKYNMNSPSNFMTTDEKEHAMEIIMKLE
jgi:hypothetical protein